MNGVTEPTKELSPIKANKRIDAMDILRGIALIGILLMNIEWFGRSMSNIGTFDTSLSGLDHAAGWLIRCFVEGKFYKLFALLFGMGFAIMLIRAKEAGRPFVGWFTRRMVVLFVFGLLHLIFLWGGDILHDYAFSGLVFLGWILLLKKERFKKYDNPRSFLKIGLVWLSVPMLLSAVVGVGFGSTVDHQSLVQQWQEEQEMAILVDKRMVELALADAEETEQINESNEALAEELEEKLTDDNEFTEAELLAESVNDTAEFKYEFEKDAKEEVAAFKQDSYWQATLFRLDFAGLAMLIMPAFTLTMLFPLFLIGYWFISSGVMKNYQQHQGLFKPMAWIGMGFGLFFTIGGLLVTQHPAAENAQLLSATGNVLFFVGQYVMTAGYIGLILTLLNSPRWPQRLSLFAPIGRMALTNYIMHSVILTSIFYGYAGGLFGQISRAPQVLIVLAIIIFQVIFSRWWLSRYQFGPLEWLWRTLTYKKIQPMKISQ